MTRRADIGTRYSSASDKLNDEEKVNLQDLITTQELVLHSNHSSFRFCPVLLGNHNEPQSMQNGLVDILLSGPSQLSRIALRRTGVS